VEDILPFFPDFALIDDFKEVLLFFFITAKPRVEGYTKAMSLKYEPASEPLHISVKVPKPWTLYTFNSWSEQPRNLETSKPRIGQDFSIMK